MEWFNSSEVIQRFTGQPGTLTSGDPAATVTMLRDLLDKTINALTRAFSEEEYDATRASLLQLRRVANEQLAPGRRSHST